MCIDIPITKTNHQNSFGCGRPLLAHCLLRAVLINIGIMVFGASAHLQIGSFWTSSHVIMADFHKLDLALIRGIIIDIDFINNIFFTNKMCVDNIVLYFHIIPPWSIIKVIF